MVSTAWLVDHLWQSTLCVGVAALLARALRHNRAAARHWIWLAASIKFLVPFSALVALGRQFGWAAAAPLAQPAIAFVADALGQPFSSAASAIPRAAVRSSIAP